MYVSQVDDSLPELTTDDVFPCASYTILNSSPNNILYYFFLMICSIGGILKNIQCDGQNIQFSSRGHFDWHNTLCIIGSDANFYDLII